MIRRSKFFTKKPLRKEGFEMERVTRLERATSSLARKETTEEKDQKSTKVHKNGKR